MKNTIRGTITLLAVVAISGAYAQSGYGEGSRIMPHPSPGASGTVAATGTKGSAPAAALSSQDRSFVNKAAKGGLMEVAMGKVAAKNATNADVKKFGQRMVADHSKANDQLAAIAKSRGLGVPKSVKAEKWAGDKEYMRQMLQDHEKDLAEFKTEASRARIRS